MKTIHEEIPERRSETGAAEVGVFDRDEAFWRKMRALPTEVKMRPEIEGLLIFKSKVAQLNRDIEDAIELRLNGWIASSPNGPLEIDHVFGWQWRRPGPRGGRLFLSTQQAITALRKEPNNQLLRLQDSPEGLRAQDAVEIGGGAPLSPMPLSKAQIGTGNDQYRPADAPGMGAS
jgi:hypothetical protein